MNDEQRDLMQDLVLSAMKVGKEHFEKYRALEQDPAALALNKSSLAYQLAVIELLRWQCSELGAIVDSLRHIENGKD